MFLEDGVRYAGRNKVLLRSIVETGKGSDVESGEDDNSIDGQESHEGC